MHSRQIDEQRELETEIEQIERWMDKTDVEGKMMEKEESYSGNELNSMK